MNLNIKCKKESFDTKIEAKDRCYTYNQRNKRRNKYYDKLRVYKCQHCDFYHLTSLPEKIYDLKTKNKYVR